MILCALILAVLAIEGGATIRGIGEDLQSLGRAIGRSPEGKHAPKGSLPAGGGW
jgi:predicted small secreted protein